MLKIERIAAIKEYMEKCISVEIEELQELLGVSYSTICRDLLYLKREGVLTVSTGMVNYISSPHWESRQETLGTISPAKLMAMDQIVSLAATLIEDVDSIFIGESLICHCLAHKIASTNHSKNLTVVTNNFNVALELSSCTKHLYLVGGEVEQNKENAYTGGPKFASNLSTIFVNKAFTSVDGVDFHAGYTMQDLSQLNILSQLPNFCSQSIFLTLSNKFGYRSVHQLAPLDFADILITDSGISKNDEYVFSKLHKPQLVVSRDSYVTSTACQIT